MSYIIAVVWLLILLSMKCIWTNISFAPFAIRCRRWLIHRLFSKGRTHLVQLIYMHTIQCYLLIHIHFHGYHTTYTSRAYRHAIYDKLYSNCEWLNLQHRREASYVLKQLLWVIIHKNLASIFSAFLVFINFSVVYSTFSITILSLGSLLCIASSQTKTGW